MLELFSAMGREEKLHRLPVGVLGEASSALL